MARGSVTVATEISDSSCNLFSNTVYKVFFLSGRKLETCCRLKKNI